MRILLTGSRGKIGYFVERALQEARDEVVGFDLASGDDVCDRIALSRAADGCEVAIHLAGMKAKHAAASPDELMALNLVGTWHVLSVAREQGMRRVVLFSSVKGLGIFDGERPPDYLPIDDRHPSYANRPYGLSKRLAEEMCRAVTTDAGISTICLRPPRILTPHEAAALSSQPVREDSGRRLPEYGAWLDVRDAADAARRAAHCSHVGHSTVLVCADEIASNAPAWETARRLYPQVPWLGGMEYEERPNLALIDCSSAQRILGWRPQYGWKASAVGK